MKGYVQVYTGDGKGKTTAALGLALRAAGAGLQVYVAQFVKGMRYSELNSLELLRDHISLRQVGRACFIRQEPQPEDVRAAREGLAEVREILRGGAHDLVILDEANIAVHFNLFSADELVEVIRERPDHVEMVITGRNAHPKVLDEADLVTEMREVKHYYREGVLARRGIES